MKVYPCDPPVEPLTYEVGYEDAMANVSRELLLWMLDHGFSAKEESTYQDLLRELQWQIEELRNPVTLGDIKSG